MNGFSGKRKNGPKLPGISGLRLQYRKNFRRIENSQRRLLDIGELDAPLIDLQTHILGAVGRVRFRPTTLRRRAEVVRDRRWRREARATGRAGPGARSLLYVPD